MLKSLFGHRSTYLDPKTINQVQSLCRSVEKLIDQNDLHRQLVDLFDHLLNSDREKSSIEILRQRWNFSLTKHRSEAHDQGVFLDHGRINDAGRLVSIYPGTVYRRSQDPLLLPSIRNQFLLARKDGLIIDGRDRGLSRSIYLSCHSRLPQYDLTWLSHNTDNHRNPLTIGHYINHFPKDRLPNVTYFEFDFRLDQIHSGLRSFIPHVRYSQSDDDDDDQQIMPSTVLISLRPIEKGEELFSCYLNLIENQERKSD